MINKVLLLIIFIISIIILNYLYIVPIYLFPSKYKYIKEIKSIYSNYFIFFVYNLLGSNLFLSNNSHKNINLINENIDKVDIILANHLSTLDFLLIACILKKFNIDYTTFTFKNDLNMCPGFFMIYADTDISVNRDWSKDKYSIDNQLNKIIPNKKKEVLIIFPEGTVLCMESLIKSIEFSKQNNIKQYNNLLIPRIKGLHKIINNLKQNNKLGNIWDLTIINDKYLNKIQELKLKKYSLTKEEYDYYFDINTFVKEDFDDYHFDINLLTLGNDLSEEGLKLWLYNIWNKKDKFIDNYKKYDYNKLCYNKSYNDFIFGNISFLLFLYLIFNKYGRYYILLMIIISYLIILKNNKIN